MKNILLKKRGLGSARGSALITSLLVMGILGAVALATMALVMKEIMITGLVVDSGKAYYAAESGVELSLLDLKKNLAGFEKEVLDGELIGANYTYKISNKSNQYPYIVPGEYSEVDLKAHPEVLYDGLDLNSSVTIPLFTVNDDDEGAKVTEFRVEFWVGFDPQTDLRVNGGRDLLSSWDILRWKIHGIKTDAVNDEFGTESINDFTAVSTIKESGQQTFAAKPTWFGSVDCDERLYNLQPGIITCTRYGGGSSSSEEYEKMDDGQYIYTKICAQTEAREYYLYEGKESSVRGCYPIKEFLAKHDYNYLTLTNLMNPNVFKDTFTNVEKEKLSKIYYRIEAYDGDGIVREYADIVSTGKSGDSEITLNVQKKKDSYIPVLNFALYHTK